MQGGSLTGTILAFVVSLLVQVGYPLAAMLIFRRRTGVTWRVFGLGAVVFAVFQLFTWLPLSFYLDNTIGARLQTAGGAFAWLLALAFVTSLFEETGRWCGYRFLFPRQRLALSWRNGIAFGLGHNALESMLLIAGLTFIYLVAYLALSRSDPQTLVAALGPGASSDLIAALQGILATGWEQPLFVAVERLLALPHQLAWSLLVMASVAYGQKRWFSFAVLYHASVAVIVPGLARLFGFGVAEGANLILALLSLWILSKLTVLGNGSAERLPRRARF